MRLHRVALILFLALALAPVGAGAQERVGLRAATHPEYTRLVFDWAQPVTIESSEQPGQVTLRFARPGSFAIEPGRRWPAPIESVTASGREAVIRFAAGARPRFFALDRRVVVDLLAAPSDATSASASVAPALATPTAGPQEALPLPPLPPDAAPAREATAAAPPPVPATAAAAPSAAQAAASTGPRSAPTAAGSAPAAGQMPTPALLAPAAQPPAPAVAPSGATPPTAASAPPQAPAGTPSPGPVAAPARTAPEPQLQPPVPSRPPATLGLAVQPARDAPERALVFPFGERVGAAAFRIGATLHIVFDEPRPADLSPLRSHPVFGGARLQMLANGTHLRMPLPPGTAPRLSRQGNWRLDLDREPGLPQTPLDLVRRGEPGSERLVALTPVPGGTITLAHPETGERLLVGTLRADQGSVPVGRTFAEFAVLPSSLGIVVLPRSDHVVLRALDEGQVILADGATTSLALAAPPSGVAQPGDTTHLTRSFDFPALDPGTLSERLRTLMGSAAGAAPGARAKPRLDTAEAMISLGLGVEALAMLGLAETEDPRIATEPRLHALRGVAGLLSGRSEAVGGLSHDRLMGSDELALWRALADLSRGAAASRHAPTLAVALPLVFAYPEPLRERLLPPIVEALAQGGLAEMALVLADRAPDPAKVELGRAFALRAQGRLDEALEHLRRIDTSRDQLARLRARIAETDMLREAGRMTPAQAADRLDPLLVAWRGDQREIDLRMRIASLRSEAGDQRAVLDLMRETRELFPEQADLARPRMVEAFTRLFGPDGGGQALPPAAAVALFDQNADLLPPGAEGLEISARLVDRLVALDLAPQADAMLRRVIGLKQPGEDQARLGARLASLRLGERDPAAALGALADTAVDGLPAPLGRERRILEARAEAMRGDRDRARAILRALGGPEAAGVEAELSAGDGDWLSAIAALEEVAASTLPQPGGTLDSEARKLLVRLASASAMAGDEVRLAALAARWGKPMAEGELSEPFRLLTARSYAGIDDLARARGDLALARGLAASLAPLQPKPKP